MRSRVPARQRLPLLLALGFVLSGTAWAPGARAQEGGASSAVSAEGTPGAESGSEDETYPVATRDLARGEVLALADIERVARSSSSDRAAPESVVGWTTRRVIAAGEALLPPAVSPPDLIKSGDAVQAVWSGGTIELRVSGTAGGSAALGERILVRIDARRRLEGVVIGPALVQLQSLDRGR